MSVSNDPKITLLYQFIVNLAEIPLIVSGWVGNCVPSNENGRLWPQNKVTAD